MACPHGGAEQLWTSPALQGKGAKWVLAKVGQAQDGIFLQANRSVHLGNRNGNGTSNAVLPQVTEFVTPDFWPPGSMSTRQYQGLDRGQVFSRPETVL